MGARKFRCGQEKYQGEPNQPDLHDLNYKDRFERPHGYNKTLTLMGGKPYDLDINKISGVIDPKDGSPRIVIEKIDGRPFSQELLESHMNAHGQPYEISVSPAQDDATTLAQKTWHLQTILQQPYQQFHNYD